MVGGEEVVDYQLRDLAEPGVTGLLATNFPGGRLPDVRHQDPGHFAKPGGQGLDLGWVKSPSALTPESIQDRPVIPVVAENHGFHDHQRDAKLDDSVMVSPRLPLSTL